MMDPSSRPTLPPLHSLGLPLTLPRIHELYDADENAPIGHQRPPILPPPVPSPQTPSSPSPYLRPSTNAPASKLIATPMAPLTSPVTPCKLRLVPTTFENADAVVLVPPRPSAPNVPPPQPLLLVGPALEHLRQPQRRLAEGTRVHPYRISRPPVGRPAGPFHAKPA